MNAIQKIESLGVKLEAKGDRLRITGNTGALTADQIEWLKAHKPQILAELRAANENDPISRLRALAPKYHLDPDDLADWYRNDLDMIERMDNNTLDALVRDYAANQPTFRGEQPYQPYRLWLYKLDKKKEGYIRQGLMTDDPERAQRQLTQIYGHAVHDLHRKG